MKNDIGGVIVISIMSYYAKQIFDGTKKFEFRKSPIQKEFLNKTIYVYSAKDDKAIIGTMKVSDNLCGNVNEILKQTGYDTRCDKQEIISYFGVNNQRCFALKLYDVKPFEKPLSLKYLRSIDPNINLPQYYQKIKNPHICQAIINHEAKYSKKIPIDKD